MKTSLDNPNKNYFFSNGPINIVTSPKKNAKAKSTYNKLKQRVHINSQLHGEIAVRPEDTDTDEVSVEALDVFRQDDVNNENSCRKEVVAFADANIDVEKKYQ